jgi:hypothetical protein
MALAEAPSVSDEARRSDVFVRLSFTLTTLLSALLLFSIQPLFAKMVLPLLGGSPSVWAVALLFFQGALLVGYGYAHLLVSKVPPHLTGFVHLAVSALAFLSLPIGIPAGWSEPPPGDPYFWQLGLFAVAIGVPFVAVAANAPLLQAWFARATHRTRPDPYSLYAASNIGSLVALLGYPFVLEPVFGLKALASVWTAGFVVLLLALAVCFWIMRRESGSADEPQAEAAQSVEVRAPMMRDRTSWVFLAFVPSALLTAFTTHIATDVASAPLIWVMPLSLYLLTFVIVFRERALIPPKWLLAIHLVAVIVALLQLAQTERDTWFYGAGLGVAAFFTSALVAHRTLYEQRPAPKYLTEFYMWMSLGGVLGGVFAALIAPRIFAEVFEYPLLLALSFACRPGALSLAAAGRYNPKVILAFAAVLLGGILLIAGLPWAAQQIGTTFGVWGSTFAVAAVLAAVTLLVWRYPPLQLTAVVLMYAAIVILPSNVHRGQAQRSYFGVYRVILSDDGQFNVLQHGTTLHGAQRVRDELGNRIASTTPGTYYHPRGPMGSAVRLTSYLGAQRGKDPRYGVIGLGAGSIAGHAASGETWRFFEIDPTVVGIAKSPQFTYLTNCLGKYDIVVGDARLTIAKEENDSFDLLIVDAFSSDAIPMHLLTAEAIALYASKLKPDGAGVLHISNRYLDLEAVLATTLPKVAGLHALVIEDDFDDGYAATGSTVVVFTKSMEALDPFRAIPGARDIHQSNLRPWTDDSSEILGPFLSKLRARL